MASGKVIGIVAGGLVGVLVVAVAGVALLAQKQAGKAAALSEALVQVASAAGMENLDPQTLPAAAQQIQETIQAVRAELVSAKDSLAASQTEASNAKAEAASQTQRVQEQSAKADSLAKELEAAKETHATALAAAEATAKSAQEAAQAAEQQVGELKQSIEQVKGEMAEQVARLESENETLRQPPPEPASAEAVVPAGEGQMTEPEVPAMSTEPEVVQEEGRIIGQSQMFSLIRYNEGNQSLFFRLHDGQTLSYQSVPPDVMDRFISASDKLDMTYRFKIQGTFKSLPPDSVVVRKYWKWHRRHKTCADVRYIGPENLAGVSLPAGGETSATAE